MKHIIILLTASLLSFYAASAQTPDPNYVNFKHSEELFFGPSASFAFGKYIQYQGSFSSADIPGTTLNGSIAPTYFGMAGFQERFSIGTGKVLEKLSFSFGANYSQRGFTSTYHAVYQPIGKDIKDETTYLERYKVNDLSFPLLIRYGKKWYVEGGISLDYSLFGSMKQKLTRSVTGANAYEGGFTDSESSQFSVPRNRLTGNHVGLTLAAGHSFSKVFGVRLTNHLFTKTFSSGDNFKSLNTQLEFIFNL